MPFGFDPVRPCPCGSGNNSWWLKDARGIECCRVCEACEEAAMKKYRPECFTDPSYATSEPVEPEDVY